MSRCGCVCHFAVGDPGYPDVRDPVAAATSCSRCIHRHCEALLDGPRLVTPQADGYTDPSPYKDTGEGAE